MIDPSADLTVTQDRKEQVFRHEGYQLFVTTGQPEQGHLSGLRVQPFNKLNPQERAALEARALPFGPKSYISVSEAQKPGSLVFTDDLTRATAAVEVPDLDRSVQARLAPASSKKAEPAKPPRGKLRRAFFAGLLGVAAVAGLGTGLRHTPPGRAVAHSVSAIRATFADVADAQRGLVHKQTVRTLFVDEEYSDQRHFSYEQGEQAPYTQVVEGKFPAAEAYRYDVVIDRFNARDKNIFVSFTSAEDLLAGARPFDAREIEVPAGARATPLSDLSAAERDRLKTIFEILRAEDRPSGFEKQNVSLPSGLVDPALYLKPGVDGYSFQTWNDISNGIGGALYFRDVAGVYGEDAALPGKKVVTDITIREEGKYCAVKGEPDEYEHQPNTNAPGCKRIESMTAPELEALKARAAAFDIKLVDETIHTYVRDAKGNVVVEDATRTVSTPVHLLHNFHFDRNGVETKDGDLKLTGPRDTYVFLDLSADGKRVEKIIGATFAKGTFPAGTIPAVTRTGKHEFDGQDNIGRPEYDVGGQKSWADTDPTGYQIRYIDGRFSAHGKTSRLPRNQRNEFGG